MKRPQLLTYNISPHVTAFSSTRHGGYSKGNYGEFNINPYCGDETYATELNRKALCEELALDEACLILPHQIHKTEILKIDEDFLKLDTKQRREKLERVDALITQKAGICISVSTADCVPILLYAQDKKVIAAVHAGWRGTLEGIAPKATKVLINEYGVNVNAIKAVIGPSISQKAFEVGNEVYEAFLDKGFDIDKIAIRQENKWHIDLWEANRMQLEGLSIDKNNIQTIGICTFYNNDDFFSARRLGINSGRIVSGIILRKP